MISLEALQQLHIECKGLEKTAEEYRDMAEDLTESISEVGDCLAMPDMSQDKIELGEVDSSEAKVKLVLITNECARLKNQIGTIERGLFILERSIIQKGG